MFNIRAYGIILDQERVLISVELIHGKEITKFPGGGLQWGEGLADCLKREFLEETGLRVEMGRCFYVTDYFVASVFNKEQQVISCYFQTTILPGQTIPLEKIKNGSEGAAEWHQLKWIPMAELYPEMFYFPIDKKVVELLRAGVNR
ncbi:MAG: NUDIX domain-containing protein [Flavobacteriales bacterium]